MAIDFFPVISSFMKIVPYIAMIQYIIIDFIIYVKKIDTSLFDQLKNAFYETTRNRIIGNYKLTYDNGVIYVNNDNIMIATFLNIISYGSANNTEFFEFCHFETEEIVNKFISLIAGSSLDENNQDFIMNCLEYYKNYMTNPEIFLNYVKIVKRYLNIRSRKINIAKDVFI